MSHPDCDNCPRVMRLEAENGKLRRALEGARRAGKRQAAPFSKGSPKPNPKRPGRKPGKAYGKRASRPIPKRVDETHDAPLPPACPHSGCDGRVHEEGVAGQYQEDIPPVKPIVRRFRVHYGRCERCGRRVQGRHPLQTSDALGAAAVQIGPEALATAAHMNKELGLTYGKGTGYREEVRRQGVGVHRRSPGACVSRKGQEGGLGTKFALSIQLNDNDGAGLAAHMNWGGGISPKWEPARLGVVTLVK